MKLFSARKFQDDSAAARLPLTATLWQLRE